MPRVGKLPACLLIAALALPAGCKKIESIREWVEGAGRAPGEKPVAHKAAPPTKHEVGLPPMLQPVPLWKDGKIEKQIDAATASLHGYLVLDLGEAWTHYVFTDGQKADGTPAPNAYRTTYLALARGEFPDNYEGERAKDDKYLELYGILPTLHLLRERYRATAALQCAKELDLAPLISFDKLLTYNTNEYSVKAAADFVYLNSRVKQMMRQQKVDSPDKIDPTALKPPDRDILRRYKPAAADYFAISAAQQRLKCEGYIPRKMRFVKGAYDWVTHEALAQFEKRHRIYGWGYLGLDTLKMLRLTPLEAECEGVLRVLTERAMNAAAVIEDGSTSLLPNGEPRTYLGADGKQHKIRNLEAELREAIVASFGLQTPELTQAWLESLGELPKGGHLWAAIYGPELPEYYDGDMVFTLEYDRGDVWYDFPYDDLGKEKIQSVGRRPRITLFVMYNGQRIPLARYGTTIGGWRSEKVGETIMWKYKESPTGWRIWQRIVASPVWLFPEGTPPKDLLRKPRKPPKPGEPPYVVKYDELGPGYASAYGLVAAYHQKYLRMADGTIRAGNDEGIRTHGSVDYMSIMRRHSHGCHRLHNHIALRLMSFILAHRPHRRLGQEHLGFAKIIEYEKVQYEIKIEDGGYVFELDPPIEVNVLEGSIRGRIKEPIEIPIPKFDPDAGAYLMPDGGGAVLVRDGGLVPIPMPRRQPDGGAASPASGATPAATPAPVPVRAAAPATALFRPPAPAPAAPPVQPPAPPPAPARAP